MIWNLQKYIATAGICSRRKAEEFIRAGRVTINGIRADVTDRVHDGDSVAIDGRSITAKKTHVYYALHKPAGYTCTHAQFPGEKSIYELLPRDRRLFSVGRLDRESSGLLIVTTDGALAEQLTHPRYEHEKEYLVTTKNPIRSAVITSLERGVEIGEEGIVRPASVRQENEHTMRLVLTEGKKRQIRRMLAAVHLGIEKLERVRIGSLKLKDLPSGRSRTLSSEEIAELTQSRTAT